MDKKLEARITRLEKVLSRSVKNEDENSSNGRFIETMDLAAILMSLAGVSNANSLLKNEKEILEGILEKYKDQDEISLDLPIKARGFVWGGSLSDLLSSVFDRTDGVMGDVEKSVKTQSYMKRKYDL